MRNWRFWIVAVILFWPLYTLFVLGYRWSGTAIQVLSPAPTTQSPVPLSPGTPNPPVLPEPLAQPQPRRRSRHSRPAPLTERDLERLDQEFFDSEVRR